jgi:hypothetical protein
MNSWSHHEKPRYVPLYSRSMALIGSFFWLIMLAGLAVLMLEMFAALIGGRDLELIWTACALLVLGYLSTLLLEPAGQVAGWTPKLPWQGWRPRLLFGGFLLAAAGLRLAMIDWAHFPKFDDGWDAILSWAIFLLLPVVAAAFLALTTELTLIGGTPVLFQLRGWRRHPFEGWNRSFLSRVGHESRDFGRWPKPVRHKMSIEQAKAYAWLAASIARRRWLLGQGIVLVSSGVLGTSLALWFTTTSMDKWSMQEWPSYVAEASIVLGLLGLRMSIVNVAMWESRAEAYKALASDRGTRARWKSARSRMY